MVTNNFRNKNLMQPRRRLNIDRQGPNLFSFGPAAEGFFFWVFCSHKVPNVFLNMFPVEPHFYSICFAQNSPLLSFIVGPRGRHSICQWKLLFWGATRVSGLCLWWANQNGSLPQKTKKELGKQPPSNELKHEYTTIVQYTSILCFPCISNLT